MTWRKRAHAQREEALDKFGLAMLLQEHSSLRDEILASYGYAQTIVRWTLATFAAVLAAGLILMQHAQSKDDTSALFSMIALAIFGFGLPGIVWLNSWGWIGELYRAERAGSYLRSLERDIAAVDGLIEHFGFQPARWETFIAKNRVAGGLWGKQTMTYLGTGGVFFGTAVASEALFLSMLLGPSQEALSSEASLAWLWVSGSLALHVAGMTIAFVMSSRLMRLGSANAPVRRSYG